MSKLVRDKIPEIIENYGKTPIYHIAKKEEMLDLLLAKLKEELLELQNAETREEQLEEQADVWEVEETIKKLFFLPLNIIDGEKAYNIMIKKNKERGGFSKGIVLDGVE